MPNKFFRYILGVSQGFEIFALVEPSSTDTLNVDLASLFISLVLRASFGEGPWRPTKPSADELECMCKRIRRLEPSSLWLTRKLSHNVDQTVIWCESED